jgi:dihydrofolate reductase
MRKWSNFRPSVENAPRLSIGSCAIRLEGMTTTTTTKQQQQDQQDQQLVTADMTMSLDGFTSGPEHLDDGFNRIMDWAHQAFAFRERYKLGGGEKNIDSEVIEGIIKSDAGAFIMGRTMFDRGEEPWGENPPFHAPVFVVTHRAREPLVRQGGTTFHFVTDGVASALEKARAAAGTGNKRRVSISGGARVFQQILNLNALDELRLHVAPVILRRGMPLFANLDKQVELGAPTAIRQGERALHLTYRLRRQEKV